MKHIMEFAMALRSEVDLPDCISDAVSRVSLPMGIARVGRLGHQHTYILSSDRRGRKLKCLGPTLSGRNDSRCKVPPHAGIGSIHRIVFAQPILHSVTARIRLGPGKADGGHYFFGLQPDHNPLRVEVVSLAADVHCSVQNSLPIGIEMSSSALNNRRTLIRSCE